ncbi:hypothetical protein [Planctomonas psychrotolerans]|uniref:hypothetical protein n=1 Tax=Planctomonas psychrotolerans TaxID=2528712 RepID=UPI0012394315|nr:hypothetical protein [Planctomonas psychrotolerans]
MNALTVDSWASGAAGESYAAQVLDDLDAALEYCENRQLRLEQTPAQLWVVHAAGTDRVLGRVEQHDGRFQWATGNATGSSCDSLCRAVTELIAAERPVERTRPHAQLG